MNEHLSKDNVNSIFTKLAALFKNGEYGTDGEYFEPKVSITPLSGESYPAGLRITVSTSSFGFNTIHIPYGATIASSEDDDFDWDNVDDTNPQDLPRFSFSWFLGDNTVRFDLDIDAFVISLTGHDLITGFELLYVNIA